jgi:hypothetical protein
VKTDPRARAAAPNVIVHRFTLPKRILQTLALASAVGGLFGCGVQGMPHPPRLERPEKVTNLTAVQMGQGLELRFSLPQHTTEGERLTKPMEIEILRSLVPSGKGLSELKPEVWTHLLHDDWQPFAQGNNVVYSLHLTGQEFHDWQGRTVVVAVTTLTRGFRHRPLESDPSNFVDVPIYDVSEPVQGVNCVTTEKAIEVRFTPPAKTLSGGAVSDLAGYRIYRSATGPAGNFELRSETATPPYRDSEFVFGKTYAYQVRAVFGRPGQIAMSDASAVKLVTPRDVFPPAPPQGLTALYTAGAVELVWTANSEPDLAGYSVYRSDGQTVEQVNKELVRTPIFRDASAQPGRTYNYHVTAVDLSGNESKASQTVDVETK